MPTDDEKARDRAIRNPTPTDLEKVRAALAEEGYVQNGNRSVLFFEAGDGAPIVLVMPGSAEVFLFVQVQGATIEETIVRTTIRADIQRADEQRRRKGPLPPSARCNAARGNGEGCVCGLPRGHVGRHCCANRDCPSPRWS